jgi:uncharacterized protein YeaO (DUF488 family)
MIYTTYFAKLKKLPENVVPIAICRYVPKGLNCYRYFELAPNPDTLLDYKHTGDIEKFTKDYKEQILARLDPCGLVDDLMKLIGNKNIALGCYEKSTDFCHRHLVADWLRNAGYACEEWYDISDNK